MARGKWRLGSGAGYIVLGLLCLLSGFEAPNFAKFSLSRHSLNTLNTLNTLKPRLRQANRASRASRVAVKAEKVAIRLDQLDIQAMTPAEAMDMLLREELDFEEGHLQKLGKALGESLEKAGYDAISPMVRSMLNWEGLEPRQAKEQGLQSAKKFPVLFTAFAAVRAHCTEHADYFDIQQIGSILEDLTKLARKMWAADDRVTGSLSMILAKELVDRDAPSDPALSTAAVINTLGLRQPFQAMALAALDIPREEMKHVSSVASMAWALAVSNIQVASLQIKVAKGIIAHIDKVSPPEVGKIFIAMHEMEWFKDADSIAYLTQALVSRVQTLKQEDPGLANMLAQAREDQDDESLDGA